MDKVDLKSQFLNIASHHEKALKIGLTTINEKLKESEIDTSVIQSRIKSFESFFEKIGRKKYENPFLNIEDIAGIRIICYYPRDVEDIEQLIRDNFNLQSSVDKTSMLDIDKFGYRSSHYVVRLKSSEGLSKQIKDCKIEIQVRTLLMHVWASIQGKLEYKKEEHSPQQFRRKLMQLSALLELADRQFQELRDEKHALRTNLEVSKSKFESGMEMNIDSFFAFMDLYFPNRELDYRYTKTLFIELKKQNITFRELIEGINSTKSILSKVEQDIEGQKNVWTKDAALKTILELTNGTYRLNKNRSYLQSRRSKLINKWRKTLSN